MRSEVLDRPATVPERRSGRRRRWAGLLSIAVSGGLLLLLYGSMDVRLILQALREADTLLVVGSILLIVPITLLRAMRFYWVAPPGALPGVGEAFRLTLVSSALNVFVPAKAGDLSKSYFVARRSDTRAGVAIAVVVYERLCDVFALMAWCLIGWAIARPQVSDLPGAFWLLLALAGVACGALVSSETLARLAPAVAGPLARPARLRKLRDLAEGWPDLLRSLRGRRLRIVSFSVVLWLAHLLQIWSFTVALAVPIPFAVCASLAAVALMAGQLPLTFAGLGTRDVALVVLLAAYMSPESAAALGVLISTRNFVPPLLAVPLIWPYLSAVTDRRQPGRGAQA